MEYRIKDVELTCENDGSCKIGGYINVTERESEILYSKKRCKWFKEVMKKGVFNEAIKRSKEIPLLFEHNWNKKLASTLDTSLSLREDQIGLRFDAIIDNSEVYELVKTGAINNCSFGFRSLKEDIETINHKLEKRYVNSIELLEVSLVKNPAYAGSLVELREYEQEEEDVKETIKEDDEVLEEKKKKDDEVLEEKKKKDDEDNLEEKQKKEEESREIQIQTEATSTIKTEEIVDVIEEVIENKELQIETLENIETDIKTELEFVKIENQAIEEELEVASNQVSSEIIRLRLEILKLKNIKDGI